MAPMTHNSVPDDVRFFKAAIEFIVDHAGCGEAQFHDVDPGEFLEAFWTASDLHLWPEFFKFCEAKGLPVQYPDRCV